MRVRITTGYLTVAAGMAAGFDRPAASRTLAPVPPLRRQLILVITIIMVW